MKKAFENAKSGIKTTILGIILILIVVAYIFLPMWLQGNNPDFHYEINSLYVGFGIVGGIGLIIMPDTIQAGMKKLIKKKTE
ncbi:MAG: hypothetical protein JXR07_19910 [Reichenbachiella sp.]